jgi:hypothetical protein
MAISSRGGHQDVGNLNLDSYSNLYKFPKDYSVTGVHSVRDPHMFRCQKSFFVEIEHFALDKIEGRS